MEKRFGPTAPCSSSEDLGSIFLCDETGTRVVVRPLPNGKPDNATAEKLLKLLNKVA
jgi:hypothetical protein